MPRMTPREVPIRDCDHVHMAAQKFTDRAAELHYRKNWRQLLWTSEEQEKWPTSAGTL